MPESIARRTFINDAAKAALVAGAAYLASRVPSAYAAEEEEILAGVASNPLGPDDLQNGNWTKPEYWENDSFEYGFKHGRAAYLRAMWSQKDSTDYAAFLIDFVGNRPEKPNCSILMKFDTYNQRLDGNDPNTTALPGVYGINLDFDKPGGNLYDSPLTISSPFPNDTLFYTWARAPSPLSNASGARQDPHTLLGILIKKNVLTSKYEEIGLQAFLYNSIDNVDDLTDPGRLLSSFSDFAKLSFKSYSVDETPWPVLVLLTATGTAVVAPRIVRNVTTRKMDRRQLLLLRFSGSGRNKHRGG